jgi:alkylated DNA repair protein (DNA oxidative demethylase)
MPEKIMSIAKDLEPEMNPEVCVLNWYTAGQRLGLHQNKDEQDLEAPIITISLGESGIFELGGKTKTAATTAVKVSSGDLIVLSGASRRAFHGFQGIIPGTMPDRLLKAPGQICLVLRQVNKSEGQ